EESDPDERSSSDPTVRELTKALEEMQKRLSQVIEAVDEQRNWNYRTILFFGMLIAACVILWIGNSLWRAYSAPYSPPEVVGMNWWEPLIVDGKPVRLGAAVVKWAMPPDMVADFEKMALQEMEKRKAATQQSAKDAATTQPTTAPEGK